MSESELEINLINEANSVKCPYTELYDLVSMFEVTEQNRSYIVEIIRKLKSHEDKLREMRQNLIIKIQRYNYEMNGKIFDE